MEGPRRRDVSSLSPTPWEVLGSCQKLWTETMWLKGGSRDVFLGWGRAGAKHNEKGWQN